MPNAVKFINQTELNKLAAAQCSMKFNGVPVKNGDVIADNGAIILLTANEGRILTGINQWSDDKGTYPFDISSDGKTGTLITKVGMTTTRSSSTYTTSPESAGTVLYTVTQDDLDLAASQNCEIYKGSVLATIGTSFKVGEVVTIKADSTVTFEGGYARFTIPSGQTDFELNSGFSEATKTMVADTIVSGLEIKTFAKPVVVWTVSSTQINQLNDSLAYLYKNGVRVSQGTQFFKGDIVKLTPDRDSRQLVNAWLNSVDESGSYQRINMVKNSNNSEATYTIETERPINGFIVSTEERPASYSITSNDISRYENAKATLKVNGVAASVGTIVSQGDTLEAKANSGRVFYNDSVYAINRGGGIQPFTQNSDSTIATMVMGSLGITGLYVDTVLAPSPDVRGYNNVYELSETQLKAVTQKRWEVNTAGDVVDYGKFFIGLISLPFAISPDYVIGDQNVRLGPLDTNIPAKLLDRDIVRLDLGTIRVVSEKGNLLDYKNTVAMLYLPYTDPVAIDLEYVIDHEIAIEYVISLYDGMATINIMSSKIDNIVLSINVDMGITIPFANVDQTPSKNSPLSIKMGFDNGIKVPFIEIVRNESILSDGFFTIPIVDEGLLSAASGYVKVEEIQLNCAATKREKELIISLLKSGVVL